MITSYTLQKNRKQKKIHNSIQNNKANAHLKIGHFKKHLSSVLI